MGAVRRGGGGDHTFSRVMIADNLEWPIPKIPKVTVWGATLRLLSSRQGGGGDFYGRSPDQRLGGGGTIQFLARGSGMLKMPPDDNYEFIRMCALHTFVRKTTGCTLWLQRGLLALHTF